MSCFTNYELIVPKNDPSYVDHVLRKIYGFREVDLWFLNNQSPSEYSPVRVTKETTTDFEIQFRISNFTALVNVLPLITVNSTRKFFQNEIYTNVLDIIHERVLSKMNPSHSPIYLDEVYPLILQLAVDRVINKFVPLDIKNQYICVSDSVPLFIGILNGKFKIVVLNQMIFDVDEGFTGIDNINNLNTSFGNWKGKWSEQLLEPIIITDESCPKEVIIC